MFHFDAVPMRHSGGYATKAGIVFPNLPQGNAGYKRFARIVGALSPCNRLFACLAVRQSNGQIQLPMCRWKAWLEEMLPERILRDKLYYTYIT
jgi:hypothetical protein